MSNPEWREAQKREIRFEEQTPDAFEVYLRWVYSHRIVVSRVAEESIAKSRYCSILCRAYILGDILLDSDFKDAVLDALATYCDGPASWMPHNEARYVFGNTKEGAPLRTWLVAVSVKYLMPTGGISNLKKFRDFHCKEFFEEFVVHNHRTVNQTLGCAIELDDGPEDVFIPYAIFSEDRCSLHEHGETECYRSKYG